MLAYRVIDCVSTRKLYVYRTRYFAFVNLHANRDFYAYITLNYLSNLWVMTAYCLCAVPAKISVYLPYKILDCTSAQFHPRLFVKLTVSAIAHLHARHYYNEISIAIKLGSLLISRATSSPSYSRHNKRKCLRSNRFPTMQEGNEEAVTNFPVE